MTEISGDERQRYITLLAEHLKQIEELAQLSPDQFEQLMTEADFETYHPGDLIIKKGEPPDHFYLILEGEARVFDPAENPPRLLNYSGRGDFLGGRALLYNRPRAASAVYQPLSAASPYRQPVRVIRR